VAKLRVLKSITFRYDGKQDRILAAANAGQAEAWSCWLTRRVALALLERSTEFLEKSSDLAKRASADVRSDLVNFERDAAIANTAGAMSNTPQNVLKDSAANAELLQQLSFTQRGNRFRLELRGERGGGADGSLTREDAANRSGEGQLDRRADCGGRCTDSRRRAQAISPLARVHFGHRGSTGGCREIDLVPAFARQLARLPRQEP
jgi:hypothetical protein